MVNTTESDIVSPSVTTEDPLGFLSEEVFVLRILLPCRIRKPSRAATSLSVAAPFVAPHVMYPAIPDSSFYVFISR